MTAGRGVLQGAFTLLRALPFAARDGQVSALSRTSGIPRPTVHRLLEQLQAVGAVTREDGRYVLSPNMMLLANLAEPAHGLREACRDILLAVRDRTGATTQCVVSGIDGPYVLDVVAGRERLPVDIYPGREMPVGSAAAKILARAAASQPPHGRRICAIDREEVVPGLTCYAATFRLPSGGVGALQLSSTPRVPSETHNALVHRAADLVEQRLARSCEAGGDRSDAVERSVETWSGARRC